MQKLSKREGKSPLGIGLANCLAGTTCEVIVDGLYETPSTSFLANLGHASTIYAYTNGDLGISPVDSAAPYEPTTKIGVAIGDGGLLVRVDGVPRYS